MNDIRLIEIDDDFLELLGGETLAALALYLNVETKKWQFVVARESGIPDPVEMVLSHRNPETEGPEWVRIVVARIPASPSAG